MSAQRHTDNRSFARKAHSSPYARPQSSGWSLRKLIEPIRRRVFGLPVEDEFAEHPQRQPSRTASPEEDSSRGEASHSTFQSSLDTIVSDPPQSPSRTVSPKRPAPSAGPSAAATLENVIDFLTDAVGTSLKFDEAQTLSRLIRSADPRERLVSQSLESSGGRPLSAIEVEGMISILKKSDIFNKPEPFRFQSVPSSRSTTPQTTSSKDTQVRRTLTKNPNGVYRWEGAGSARKAPRRNRYASPAFGSSQITPEKPKANGDMKRRKVDDNTSPPTPGAPSSSKLPLPSPQTPRNNGPSAPKLTIQATPSRLRTPLKPTAPSQPSPLRQAWSRSPTNSQEDFSQSERAQSSPPPNRQTETALELEEIVKKVTPKKKPDLSNPYQTANPTAKVMPPRRSARRKPVAKPPVSVNGKGSEKSPEPLTEEQIKDIPSQAFVEATLPKGSKRSRPPPQLQKSPSPEPSGSTLRGQPSFSARTIDEDDEDEYESARVGKKAKALTAPTPQEQKKDIQMTNGTGSGKAPSASIFGSSSAPAPPVAPAPPPVPSTNRLTFNAPKTTTAPSRPSNLRFSYQPEGSSAPSSPSSDQKSDGDSEMSAPPPPTFTSTFSNLPPGPSTSSLFSAPKISPSQPKEVVKADTKPSSNGVPADPKTRALEKSLSSLPSYTFSFPSTSSATYSKEREVAKSKPAASLPTYDFSKPSNSGPSTVPGGSAPTKSFDWSAAGLKAPTASSGKDWTCSTCMLSQPDSAKDKCTVCEAPRPNAAPAAPPTTFDWSAAGLKAPAPSSGKDWTCSTCMLSQPDSAKDKCTVCEAPRPNAAPAAPPATFNWAAAGMKAPSTNGASWTCSTCMCSNPASATEKCEVCDSKR
ncbi:hypothetical protein DFP72DRAFT_1061780 [Ephemerocybe angulata]|uniref:RanBP2-type domain-containing protein n=1 Tax=Ephemerocybe angulata TaxID=980116 RepID=A0A8H6IC87_9AGAR|nr:hypothetical protein DFP72DRAFT_1061780 [Tulosesus angulatus]